jgi:hypothetical protein
VLEYGIPVSENDIPVPENDFPMPENDFPVSENEIPVSENGIPVPENGIARPKRSRSAPVRRGKPTKNHGSGPVLSGRPPFCLKNAVFNTRSPAMEGMEFSGSRWKGRTIRTSSLKS